MPIVSIDKLKTLCTQQDKDLEYLKDGHQISQSTLERIARGENSNETVVSRLETLLGISRAEFLFDTECLEGAFLFSLSEDLKTGVVETALRKQLKKLAEQASNTPAGERGGIVNDAINAICRALNKSRQYLHAQDEEELARVNELAQSLALEVLGRMVLFHNRAGNDEVVDSGEVPLTMLGVLLHHITGHKLKVRLHNPQARLADDIAECQYIWRITPKPNGSETYSLRNTLWALIEVILPDAPIPEAERERKYKGSVAALRRRLNELANLTEKGKTVVGLYFPDTHGDQREFLIDLHKDMKAACPLVYMHGEEEEGLYLMPSEDLVALLGSVWSHWLAPSGARSTPAEMPPTQRPTGENEMLNPNVAITGCHNSTIVIADQVNTGHQHTWNQPMGDILNTLIPALRALPDDTPAKARADLESIAIDLEIENTKPAPEPGRLRALLNRAKTIAEYVAAGETIVKYAGMGLAVLGVAP